VGAAREATRKVLALFRQGLTPEEISLAVAVAIALGIFPVLGSTTLLCVAVAAVFGLNLGAMQLVNWVCYPLQLILFVPLLRIGSKLVDSENQVPSLSEIGTRLAADLWGTIHQFWLATLGAVLVWLIACPFLILLIYSLAVRPLRRIARGMAKVQTEP
jgi:uncharacterized protein (DUF2062 family)